MSLSTNVGHLKQLYLEDIEPLHTIEVPRFQVIAAAHLLLQKDDRNWVPLVVREVEEDQYQLIGNTFVYAVAEAAGLEKVWCIVADNSPETVALAQALSQEEVPKISLTTASRDEIKAAFEYLKAQPKTTLKSVNLSTAVDRIAEADRRTWKTFDPITKLKCGITKAKLKDLEQVFYLSPPATAPETPTPTATPKAVSSKKPTSPQPKPQDAEESSHIGLTKASLNEKTVPELKKMAQERNLSFSSKSKKADLVALLLQSQ